MATYSTVLAWRIPGTGAWWAALYGVTQSRTWLTWLNNSSRVPTWFLRFFLLRFSQFLPNIPFLCQEPIPDPTLHVVAMPHVLLGCDSLSDLSYLLWPWEFWGIVVRYFIKCFSIWIINLGLWILGVGGMVFPCSSAGKESTCNAEDLGSIPGLEDPLEKGKVNHSSILNFFSVFYFFLLFFLKSSITS